MHTRVHRGMHLCTGPETPRLFAGPASSDDEGTVHTHLGVAGHRAEVLVGAGRAGSEGQVVYVSALRRTIDRPGGDRSFIETVRGVGYRLADAG